MPLVQPMPFVRQQWFDANGDPVANGFLYTYEAGTNTPLATYNDSTGGAGALNPNPVLLDSGGYADVWLTAASYKLVLEDENHVQLWSIDGVPGLGSLIAVGDLPPLFTSQLAGGALNFTLDDVAPRLLFGRFAGTTGVPSFGAIGSTTEITTNQGGEMVGDPDFTWDAATLTLTIRDGAGGIVLRLQSSGAAGKILFGSSTAPYIHQLTDWQYTALNAQNINFGRLSELKMMVMDGTTLGRFQFGIGSAVGILALNDGTGAAGVFAGASIICGSVADPNGTVVAATGSLFITTNGGAGATLWVKESSPTTSTGWVAK